MEALQNLAGHNALIGVIAISIVGFYLVRSTFIAFRGPAASVPGPWYTRFTALPVKYYWLRGQRHTWVHSLHQKYGPVVRVRPTEVAIADLQATREIHRISTPFLKTDFYMELTGRAPPGLFSMSDPKQHSARRRLLATPLSESSLKNVEPTVNSNIQKTMDGMGKEMKQDGQVDLFKWFLFMATDVIGELCFAESFRMLDQGKPNQYVKDLQSVGLATALRTELGRITRVLGHLGIQPFSTVYHSVGRFREYSQQSLKRYENHVAMNPTNPKPTLFTKIMQKIEGEGLPQGVLVREGQGFIVAGSDTTAVTTTYLVYAIMRHPEVRDRLIAELSALPDNFGWEDVRELPYLNKCLEETLRVYGAAPSCLPRAVPKGGAHLAGYTFPEDFTVSTQAYSLHRDPSIFTDPERFDPDRWDHPTESMQHAFMPWGGGSRVCVGLHLAKAEMRMAAALFFRRFPRARVLTSDKDMEPKAYFLIQPLKKECIALLS